MREISVSKDSQLVPAAISPSDRIDAIDALRGLALFGVLAVNLLTEFRVSIFQQFLPTDAQSHGLDGFVETFVSFALESKAFSLFSMLFGVSLAMQFERLSRSDRPYYLLARRLTALLGFGLLHLFFIWNGDILTAYALAGLLILPFLSLPRGSLAIASGLMFARYVVAPMLPPLIPWPDAATLSSHVAAANHIYATGGYLDVWRFSVDEVVLLLPLHAFVFPRTLALFLFGAYVWRSGVLRKPAEHRRLFLGVAAAGIVVGLALTRGSASHAFANWGVGGLLLNALAPVVLATGYGAFVIWVAQLRGARAFFAPFAAVGRMAFTNYILQSIIFGFIFFGYGLGLFGSMKPALALLLGGVVYGLQAILSTAWLHRFRFGPLEWLWRTLMYGRMQPMRMDSIA